MSEGVSNPRSTQNLARRENFAPAIPDIPAGADISQAALRQILQALRNNVNQLYGDGPRSAMTLERALATGIVEPKPPSSGGARPNIDPRTGYGAVTWSGHRVPPPPEVVIGTPSTVSSLTASAGFSGVYLTWSSPNRSGGSFEIYRAETNSRNTAYRVATVTGLSYYDSTVSPEIIGDGTATGKQYYYWVKSISIKEDGSLGDAFFWSGDEDEGVPWTLNPDTFSRVVADSILAGSLHVAIDFSTDGAIRSGKEIVDGVPNSAAGFYINGNNFYFGSDGDGSYIRWNGASLVIRGTLDSAYIKGGVVEGAVLSGNYLFFRDMIYSEADPAMPANALYQNEYSGLNPEGKAIGDYETRYLVRNQIVSSDALDMPDIPYVSHGFTLPYYYIARTISDGTAVGMPYPYSYADADTTHRCVGATAYVDWIIEYNATDSVVCSVNGGASVLQHLCEAQPSAIANRNLFQLQVTFSFADSADLVVTGDYSDTVSYPGGVISTLKPTNDPGYAAPGDVLAWSDGVSLLGSVDVFTANDEATLSNGDVVTVLEPHVRIPPYTGTNINGFPITTGTGRIRIRRTVTYGTGAPTAISAHGRLCLMASSDSRNYLIPGGDLFRLYAQVVSDNTT